MPGEPEKSKLDQKPDGTVKAKKRYLIGHDLHVRRGRVIAAKEVEEVRGGVEPRKPPPVLDAAMQGVIDRLEPSKFAAPV